MADIIVMKTTGKKAPKVEKGQGSGPTLLKGPYKTKTWNHYKGEKGRLYSGIWESTPGKVKVALNRPMMPMIIRPFRISAIVV